MKKGDKVRPKVANGDYPDGSRVIAHVGKDWILYDNGQGGGENCMYRTKFEEKFEVIPDFFAEGVEYFRDNQSFGYRQWFGAKLIRQNGDGSLTAFGSLQSAAPGVGISWVTMDEYDWRDGGWVKR